MTLNKRSLVKLKFSKSWHMENPMPRKATSEQRIQWYINHHRECDCRDIPDNIKILMKLRKPKIIVGVLVKNKNKYLLVEENLESGRNKWIIPGGKVEFGEKLEYAAAREINEETGMSGKLKYLTHYEAIFPDYNYHTVIFFYLLTTTKTRTTPDIEGKVIRAKWFTKKDALKLNLVESAEWLLKYL